MRRYVSQISEGYLEQPALAISHQQCGTAEGASGSKVLMKSGCGLASKCCNLLKEALLMLWGWVVHALHGNLADAIQDAKVDLHLQCRASLQADLAPTFDRSASWPSSLWMQQANWT